MKLGLDISTSCVGWCVLNSDNSISGIGFIDLSKKITLRDKADYVVDEIKSIQRKYGTIRKNEIVLYNCIDRVNVEEPMMMFMGGKSRAQTIAKLQQFNGIISYLLEKNGFWNSVKHYNVRSARKNIGFVDRKCDKKIPVKERVYQHCLILEPLLKEFEIRNKNGKLKDEFYDMIDAYVIARQGE